jgi:UDP-N-acetylmuramoyl-L-alanyl-D-glutamate--2,6-diaminopimelate ligase
VFTNLTGDHLDYHGEMDSYAAAKAKLFETLDSSAVAIVNAESDWAPRMTQRCKAKVITFGMKDWADYHTTDIAITAAGSKFILIGPDGRAEVRMKLIGRHNVENALAAAAVCAEAFGLTVHQIAAGLRDAAGAPGRLQRVDFGEAENGSTPPFTVLVDYAHTDDALRNVLSSLRTICRGRLRVLFGCGGDRDRTKRPRMAAVACALADDVYITSDNPRTEDPQAIIDQILTGVPADASDKVRIDPDRRAAIGNIVHDAESGDVVLLAGKGHEAYQIVGKAKMYFDDAAEARKCMNVARATSP